MSDCNKCRKALETAFWQAPVIGISSILFGWWGFGVSFLLLWVFNIVTSED